MQDIRGELTSLSLNEVSALLPPRKAKDSGLFQNSFTIKVEVGRKVLQKYLQVKNIQYAPRDYGCVWVIDERGMYDHWALAGYPLRWRAEGFWTKIVRAMMQD